jgi:hypothetical protein
MSGCIAGLQVASLRVAGILSLPKTKSAILMVKSAENVGRNDATAALDGPEIRSIFAQAEMGPRRIVV